MAWESNTGCRDPDSRVRAEARCWEREKIYRSWNQAAAADCSTHWTWSALAVVTTTFSAGVTGSPQMLQTGPGTFVSITPML